MAFHLFLLRHAETETQRPGQPDFDRELLPHGHDQIALLKQQLIKKEIHVDTILSSPAKRAKTTSISIAEALKIAPERIQFDRSIYTSDVDGLVELVNELNDQNNHVLIVGHNPTLSELTAHLTQNPSIGLHTCELASIELIIDSWKKVKKGSGKLKEIIKPLSDKNT